MFEKCRTVGALALGLVVSIATAAEINIQQDFSTNPTSSGWVASGDASLFSWDPAGQKLNVIWDSSKPNSYFAVPLGRSLDRIDSFTLQFDLYLTDFLAGSDPAKRNPFQLGVALINQAQATAPGFHRGSGFESPNLLEFSFFPDPGGDWLWGPSLTSVICDRTGSHWASGGFAPTGLTSNAWFHITMTYSATNQSLKTTVTQGGLVVAALSDTRFGTTFEDYRVDHLAIPSYSDAGQDPAYSGSILAHGSIDNISLHVEEPGIGAFSGALDAESGAFKARLHAREGWLYTLQCSTNYTVWNDVSATVTGTGGPLELEDANPPAGSAVYRFRAQAP